jgi:hypothetical protein
MRELEKESKREVEIERKRGGREREWRLWPWGF